MKRNIVTKSEVPPPPYECALVNIPIAAVPFTLGALVVKSQKYWYASPDDWHRGRKLLAEFGKGLLMPCGRDIVNSIDRLYSLLDAGLNGTARSVAGEGTDASPFVYTPPLAQSGTPSAFSPPSLRSDARSSAELLDNLINGTVSATAPGEAIPNGKLERIAVAVEALGELDDDQLEQLIQIVSILGAV